MVRVRRSAQVAFHRTPDGVPVRLCSEKWTVVVHGRRWRLMLEYLRPGSVETDTAGVRIVDHLGLLRLVMVLVWVVAATRRFRR